MRVHAASANVEYTGGISLTEIVQQLNQQLGLSSTVENWTFYTTGTADIWCTSFQMEYPSGSGKYYEMLKYVSMGYEDSEAYAIYQNDMESFRQQESSGYFPINATSQKIPIKTVDLGEVYYNIQTPFPVEGNSRMIISYKGSVDWTNFLDCIGVGVSVSMQCRGTTYTVNFVAPSAEPSTPGGTTDTTDGNGSSDGTSQGGQTSGGNENTGGGTTGGGQSAGSSSGTVIQARMYDHTKSSAEQPDAIVPGRTSMSTETLLSLTASTEGVPTIKESGAAAGH